MDAQVKKHGYRMGIGLFGLGLLVLAAPAVGSAQETLHPGNVIVQGSICASYTDLFDPSACEPLELFNRFEALKLKDGKPFLLLEDINGPDWGIGTDVHRTNSFTISNDSAPPDTVPFIIRPNAPDASLLIENNGNVGLGESDPLFPLHVLRAPPITPASTTMLSLENTGPTRLMLNNTVGDFWVLNSANNGLRFNANGDPNTAFLVDVIGNVTIGGMLTQASSRAVKTAVEPVDGKQVLAKVAELPLAEWSYRDDKQATRHVGPMAEDFHASFELGRDAKHLAALDTAGVALAAIQGLNQLLAEKDARLTELEQQNALLMERLSALEEKLTVSKNPDAGGVEE